MSRSGPILLPVFVLLLLAAETVAGQNARISAGYSLRNFSIQSTPNPNFEGNIGFTQKGFLHAELEQIFRHRLTFSLRGDYLLKNGESPFIGGPIDFNQFSISTNLGLQFDRIGIYAGVHGGYTWNVNFSAIDNSSDEVNYSLGTRGSPDSLFGGLQIGARYYLFKYLRLEAEFKNSSFLKDRFTPGVQTISGSQITAASFGSSQFSVGISITIPFRSRSSKRAAGPGSRAGTPLISAIGSLQFQSPLEGPALITSSFGHRWGRMHEGVDLDAQKGDRVLAAADGIVIEAGTSLSYGKMVIVRHGSSYTSYYSHLSRIHVRNGQNVRRGEMIGLAGDSGVATGVHLHFELRKDGNPLNPEQFIRF